MSFLLHHKNILACTYVYDEEKDTQRDMYGYIAPCATQVLTYTYIYTQMYI